VPAAARQFPGGTKPRTSGPDSEGLVALDQLPRLREGFYLAFHSAILAGRIATPNLLNTEDNEKSFANVSEVAGNSRIKM
jgi:hypothetical protein